MERASAEPPSDAFVMSKVDEPMLTLRQRQKVASEIRHLAGPHTSDADMRVIDFVAHQVGRQTAEEVEFCKRDGRGRG